MNERRVVAGAAVLLLIGLAWVWVERSLAEAEQQRAAATEAARRARIVELLGDREVQESRVGQTVEANGSCFHWPTR